MQKHITIVCFAGPSGSGKSELVQRLLDMYPDNVCKWKQATTRAKRGPDDDYVFMTKPMYDVVRSTLTCRTDFNGNSYGTFPEPLVDDSAVLTIADAMGLADLEQDVAEHNKRVQAGHPGKLGSYPVKLVRVLMVYDLSDAEIEKRGGTRGGTRDAAFLQGEIDRLKAFQFESIVDSTGGWPDPVEFFDSVVWPAIANPFDGETADDLRQEIRALCGDIITAAKDIEDLDALRIVRSQLGDNVLGYMDEWKQSMPEPEDDIDMLLAGPTVYSDGAAQMPSSADLDAAEQIYSASLARAADEEAAEGAEPTQATDYLNDRQVLQVEVEGDVSPEVAEEIVEAVTEQAEPLVSPGVSVVEVDTTEASAPEVPSEEAVVGEPESTYEQVVQAAEVTEDVIQAASEGQPQEELVDVAETVASASVRAPSDIFAGVDITDWMMEQTIGIEAFESEHSFKTIFSQYVSANGGDPNGISVSSQSTKDGKGGRVVEYVAYMPSGERFGIEFNERLKRAINYGQR